MSISPKANCNLSLSLASFAFVFTCSSFSSYKMEWTVKQMRQVTMQNKLLLKFMWLCSQNYSGRELRELSQVNKFFQSLDFKINQLNS